jgi:hypothetical protein
MAKKRTTLGHQGTKKFMLRVWFNMSFILFVFFVSSGLPAEFCFHFSEEFYSLLTKNGD